MAEMITPPVPADVIAQVEQEAAKAVEAPAVADGLSVAQRLVKADKSSAVAAVVHVSVPLVAALGLHLSGADVAILASIVSSGLTYFVGLNFRTRAKLGK